MATFMSVSSVSMRLHACTYIFYFFEYFSAVRETKHNEIIELAEITVSALRPDKRALNIFKWDSFLMLKVGGGGCKMFQRVLAESSTSAGLAAAGQRCFAGLILPDTPSQSLIRRLT